MPDPKKLEIDLSETFQHLTHAPIVEAVIDIRARAQTAWEEATITQQLKPRLGDYPKIHSRTHVQQHVTIGQGEPKSFTRDLGWHGLDCQSADEKHFGRFSRDGIQFARLQPYQRWEELSAEALRLWQIYVEVAKPLEIQRLGLRFINRIEMQPGEVRCEDFIKIHHEPPAGMDLPIIGFFHQDTLAVPGHPFAINLIRTIQPAETPGKASLAVILDIDAFTTAPFQLHQDELLQRLRQMRWLKNKVFFGNITEKALNRFK